MKRIFIKQRDVFKSKDQIEFLIRYHNFFLRKPGTIIDPSEVKDLSDDTSGMSPQGQPIANVTTFFYEGRDTSRKIVSDWGSRAVFS